MQEPCTASCSFGPQRHHPTFMLLYSMHESVTLHFKPPCCLYCRCNRAVRLPAAELPAAGAGRAVTQHQRQCATCCIAQSAAHIYVFSNLQVVLPAEVAKLLCRHDADIYISVFLDRLLVRSASSTLRLCYSSHLYRLHAPLIISACV